MFKEGQSVEQDSLADDAKINIEGEKNGEAEEKSFEQKVTGLVDNVFSVVSQVETDLQGPSETESVELKEKVKEFFETKTGKTIKYTGIGVGVAGGGVLLWALKDVYVVWKFAQKFIKNGGNMSFKDGMDIVDEALSHFKLDKKKA